MQAQALKPDTDVSHANVRVGNTVFELIHLVEVVEAR